MSEPWQDPYTYPGTKVLVNKFNVQDFEALRRIEYDATAARIHELRKSPAQGNFDLDHLQAIHRHIFQDLYSWSGELRTVNLGKGGHRFTPTGVIKEHGAMISEAIAADDHLRGLPKAEYVAKLAGHYANLNKLHPFREGNGRATQTFLALLVREGGYIADFKRVGKEQWNIAAAQSFEGTLRPIQEVFAAVVSPARAVAFDRLERGDALRRFPELRGSFEAFDRLMDHARRATSDTEILRQVAVEGKGRISKDLHADKLVQLNPRMVNKARSELER